MAVIPRYTPPVETAISVPDTTFDEVTKRARELGMSRSEFFTIAARHYLEELDSNSLTARINQAITTVTPEESSGAAVSAGRDRLAGSQW